MKDDFAKQLLLAFVLALGMIGSVAVFCLFSQPRGEYFLYPSSPNAQPIPLRPIHPGDTGSLPPKGDLPK